MTSPGTSRTSSPLLAATLRSLVAHKLRLLLTTASIALGVALLAGTLMLTATLQLAISQAFGQVSSGTDAVVRQEGGYSAVSGVGVDRGPLPAEVLEQVRSVEGVAVAEGAVRGYALLTDPAGKAVLPSGGAPTMGYSLPADVELRGDVELRSGTAPAGPDEVVIDATSAEQHAIALGEQIRVLFRGPPRDFTVVGTVGYGDSDDLGGTSAAYFDTATAQQVLGAAGAYDEIVVRSTGDVSDAVLTDRLTAAVPSGIEAVTGAAVAEEASDAVSAELGFLNVLLGGFAGVALFVGAFIIWNTFTMTVTQRTREIALLRAVGATRRQVLTSLLAEAAVLGFGASALGVVLGAGVATGLTALMDVLGLSLPSTTLQVQPRTIVVSLLVGTLVTLLAAVVPARRATTVLPVEALRDATPGAHEPSRLRGVLGGLLAVGGLGTVLAGLRTDDGVGLVGLGVAATMLGVLVLAPVAARPLTALIGAPLRRGGVAGVLARDNAMRNPRRTASTATALMIGLTLVVGMGVFASSFKASLAPTLEDTTTADLFVKPAGSGDAFSPEVARLAAAVPDVAAASPTGFGSARFDGAEATYSSVDPATVAELVDLGLTSGSAAALGDDGVLVSQAVAAEHGWVLGDEVPVTFAATGATTLVVRGVYSGTGFLTSGFLISLATEEAYVPDRLTTSVLLAVDDSATVEQVRTAVAAALADHPDATVMDREGFAASLSQRIDQLLAFMTVLLLLAVVIALLGIVNTLALSVHERTREVGLLRAVGMTTGQVRAMVRWEALIISLLGAGTGAALGIGLGLVLARALEDEGISQVDVPYTQVGICLLIAAAAGVLAAVGPARAASRVDVLRAVVTD